MEPHTLRIQDQTKEIEDFFSEYENSFNLDITSDVDTTKKTIHRNFASCFVESSPAGVICGHNDKVFLKKAGHGLGFHEHIVSRSMTIGNKAVDWHHTAVRDKHKVVIACTNYLPNLTEDQIRIFAYIAGDEQKAVKKKSLV